MADMDLTHDATPYKLEKARGRGQVAKSRELVSVAVFTAAMAYLAWRGWGAWRDQFLFDQALLLQATRLDGSAQNLWRLIDRSLLAALWMALPFFGVLVVAAAVANMAQTGPVFAFEALKFDFSRLDPANSVKNLFNVQLVFNGARSVVKLLLLTAAAWMVLNSVAADMRHIGALTPAGLLHALLDALASLGLKLALVLWLIALVDVMFTRRQFARKMRMSSREFKDEIKQREGDPRVRGRLRELRNELRKRTAALRNTRNADVLVTNPTHVATALRYEHGQMAAPELIAKGSGHLAAAMRAIAARHNIPVVQSPSLARKLFRELDVERPLPPEYFGEVARIIVWVMAMKQARHRASRHRASGAAA
jgi:flagellar biosynthesis protein FlhB